MKERVWDALKRLREGKKDLPEITQDIGAIERSTDIDHTTSRGWSVYDSGAHGQVGYFERGYEGSFEDLIPFSEVATDIAGRRANGHKVITLDVMGGGRIGIELGATKSIGWIYQNQGEQAFPGRFIETGDLMDSKIVESHLRKLETDIAENYELTDIFFRPEGGIGMYGENMYALSHLYENIFRRLYKIAPVGARFYFSMVFSASSSHGLMKALKAEGYCLRQKARSPVYLLTKTSEKLSLPSLRVLSKTYSLEQKYPNT
jgi:hypothetical protein